MGFPEQPAGLAHQFAAGDFRDPRAAAGDGHPQTAADEQIYSLAGGSRLVQGAAGRQGELDRGGRQYLEAGGVHVGQIGTIPETVERGAHSL